MREVKGVKYMEEENQGRDTTEALYPTASA